VIAVKDNELVDFGQRGERTLHRIRCTARRVLDHDHDAVGGFKPTGKIGGLRPDDENAGIRPRAVSGSQHARNHGDTGNGMHRFREQ
jgi:hypothetical protein